MKSKLSFFKKSMPKPIAFLISCFLSSALVRLIPNKKIKNRVASMEDTIQDFMPDLHDKDKKKIERQMVYDYFVYQISLKEYFLFHFENLNDFGKRTFVGDQERYSRLSKLNDKKTEQIFDDKYSAYQHLKQFYRRDLILLENKGQVDSLQSFISVHNDGIVKPQKGSFGKSIQLLDFSKPDLDLENILSELTKNGPMVLEERIEQVAEMAAFHPKSINTVRYATFNDGKTVQGLFSFVRMGQGNSIVDNGGSGGIFASIDIETGIVKTPGYMENGKSFLKHPETDMQIIGFRVPQWDELQRIATEAALVLNEQRYISWDLALTKDGWVIVEANCRGQFLNQICEQKGAREQLQKIFNY